MEFQELPSGFFFCWQRSMRPGKSAYAISKAHTFSRNNEVEHQLKRIFVYFPSTNSTSIFCLVILFSILYLIYPLICISLSCCSRCSWLYTSVTMTSILLRFLLLRRRCAGMWWTCAKSRGKRTATCLRCGVDLVSDSAVLFMEHVKEP